MPRSPRQHLPLRGVSTVPSVLASCIVFLALGVPALRAQTELLALEFNEDDQGGFSLWPSPFSGPSSIAAFPTDPLFSTGMTTVTVFRQFPVPPRRQQNLRSHLLINTTPTGTFRLTNTNGLPQSAINGFKLAAVDPASSPRSRRRHRSPGTARQRSRSAPPPEGPGP